MIANPDWFQQEEGPGFYQVSMECIERLTDCRERFDKGEIDADTCFKTEMQILVDEFDVPEFLNFAVENLDELLSYIDTGRTSIRIHKDVDGKMWFGVG